MVLAGICRHMITNTLSTAANQSMMATSFEFIACSTGAIISKKCIQIRCYMLNCCMFIMNNQGVQPFSRLYATYRKCL